MLVGVVTSAIILGPRLNRDIQTELKTPMRIAEVYRPSATILYTSDDSCLIRKLCLHKSPLS
jgi:hypothetical protein